MGVNVICCKGERLGYIRNFISQIIPYAIVSNVSVQFRGRYKKEIQASTTRCWENKHFTPFIYTAPECIRSKERDFQILRLTYPCLDDV